MKLAFKSVICFLACFGFIFLIQIGNYNLPIESIIYTHVSMILLGSLFISRSFSKLSLAKSAIIAIAFWIAGILAVRLVTPRIILAQMYFEATSIQTLDIALWTNTNGGILVMRSDYDDLEGKFSEPVLIDCRDPVTSEEFKQILESALKRKCVVNPRMSKFDICLRVIGISVRI